MSCPQKDHNVSKQEHFDDKFGTESNVLHSYIFQEQREDKGDLFGVVFNKHRLAVKLQGMSQSVMKT